MNEPKNLVKIEEIKQILPHRYPFLLIDLVKNIEENEKAIGIKNVTFNEPFFQGHFPSKPIMAQTAAVLVAKSIKKINPNILVYFMTIEKAKFRKLVEPGDQLSLMINVLRKGKRIWKFNGEASVDNSIVAESEFSAMMVDPDRSKVNE